MNTWTKLSLAGVVLLAEGTIAVAQSGVGNDPNRLICRRTTETGSLVRARRQCFTKAEWDRMAEAEQTGARKVVDGLSARPGGN